MVERLRPLVDLHRERRPPAVRFRPETWRPWLEPRQATHVLNLGIEDPSGLHGDRIGDRMISREDLAALRKLAGDSPEGLRDLLAAMIWGSGTTNGRGPRYTAAALSDPRLPHVLETTRRSVRTGDLSGAYRQFKLAGVRRSFLTKWLAAVDDREVTCDRSLILDDRVLQSLNALGWYSGKRLVATAGPLDMSPMRMRCTDGLIPLL